MKTNIRKFTALLLTVAAFACSAPTALAGTGSGVLCEGESSTFTVFLESGEWFEAEAFADSDCLDLDLIAFMPGGGVVDADTLDDTEPAVGFYAPYTGTYRLRVVMEDTYLGKASIFRLVTY